MSLISSHYPYHCGSVELDIPYHKILEATSSIISQPFLSIEPYKYNIMFMVERDNYRDIVMLLD